MAKVKAPLHSIQATGTVGGLTYARNHYGAYARNYASTTPPDTSEQLLWRQAIADANSNWQNPAVISNELLDMWRMFADTYTYPDKFGNPRKLAPKEWYIKFNVYRLRKGLSGLQYPPIDPNCYFFPEVNFFRDTGGIYVDVFPRPPFQNFLYISRVPAQNHTRNFCPNLTEFGGFVDSSTTLPLKIWDSADVDTNPHNWFFRFVVVDQYGRPSNKVYHKLYSNGSAPVSTFLVNNSNYFFEDSIFTNYHNQTYFLLGNYPGVRYRGIMSVDLTGITYSSVSKSWLYMYGQVDKSSGLHFHQRIQTYVYNQCNWIEYATGSNWGQPGGQAGVDYVSDPFFDDDVTILTNTWSRYDITDQMNAWISGAVNPAQFWLLSDSLPNGLVWAYSLSSYAYQPFILNLPVI